VVKTIGNVQQDAQVRAVASGTLSNGDTVIVNSDGTVSAVAISSASSGTAVMFDDEDGSMGISYDSANGKIVVAYSDPQDVGRGKAVVGTVSGTSITFGSPATFNSSTTYGVQIAYDANAGKHVIIYMDSGNSFYGTSIVATVSGTSISYGSAVVFESGYTTEYSIAYNPTAQKVVLFYRAANETNDGSLRVGTVSGTSISYGTVNRFEDGAENQSICYDSVNDKMVIAYRDATNGGDSGVARVATVSGTSISVGSEVTYESGDSFRGQIAYDEASGNVVIAYAEETNNNYGTAIAGSVSGTSITFGTKAVFNTEDSQYLGITYDAKAGKTIIAFKDGSGGTSAVPVELSGTTISFGTTTAVDTGTVSYRQRIVYDATSESNVIILQKNNDGYAVVYQAPSTNLTSDNFIGFADSGYVNGQNVGVDSTCSVNREQTSLTAGQKYYVQTDGSLSETAGSPSVEAGTAISSTEILVKG